MIDMIIHHVQVTMPVGGEDDARSFYGSVLGFPELRKPESLAARGGCWFAVGDLQVHLSVVPDFTPARKAHVAYQVQDLEAIRQRLTNAGLPIIEDDLLPGFTRFYSEDPFGNRIEFLSPHC